jgi:streptogramin lyase
MDLAIDRNGSIFVADLFNDVVRRIDAGDGNFGFMGDEVQATQTSLSEPSGLSITPTGDLYIAESFGHRIRLLPQGANGITTFARIAFPNGLFIDEIGTIYFTEGENHHIRRVDPGDPVFEIPAIPVLRSDFNDDTRVDFLDFLIFASAFGRNFGETGYAATADLDANGSIDFTDFLIFVEAFRTETSS